MILFKQLVPTCRKLTAAEATFVLKTLEDMVFEVVSGGLNDQGNYMEV
jgi:hypothetical protein